MRKRTVSHVADTIFWYGLYFLPILTYLVYVFAVGQNPSVIVPDDGSGAYVFNFDSFISSFVPITIDNVVFNALYNIFGDVGIVPLFDGNPIFIFFTYYVSVYLLHLAVDFILFIPKIAHKWLKNFTRGDE